MVWTIEAKLLPFAGISGHLYIEMFDDNGKLVYASIISNLKSEIQPVLASGIYFLRITTANNIVVKKLVKL